MASAARSTKAAQAAKPTAKPAKAAKPAAKQSAKATARPALDGALRPPQSPESDTGLSHDSVRALAVSDARSGAWDRFAIEAQVGQLPAEDFIDREIARKQSEHLNTLRNRELQGQRLVHDVAHNHVTADGRLTSGVAAELDLRDSHSRVERITAIRDEAVAHLEGRVKDADGTPWTGSVPAPPTLPPNASFPRLRLGLRPDRVRQWMVDIGFTLVALVFELVIVKLSMDRLIRDDSLIGWVYALPPLLIATIIPNTMGVRLSGALRRGTSNLRDIVTLLMGVVWIATVVLLAVMRTAATEATVRAELAADSLGAFTESTVPAEALAAAYNPVFTFSLWFVVIFAIGVTLIAVKVVFYNPKLTCVLKADNALALAQRDNTRRTSEHERLQSAIAYHRSALESTAQGWEHYVHEVLPSHGEELKAHYRQCLINAVGDPEFTGAVVANTALRNTAASTSASAAPAHPPVPEFTQQVPPTATNGHATNGHATNGSARRGS